MVSKMHMIRPLTAAALLALAGASQAAITVYTTRPDTLFGASFMVLAPEHPLVDLLVTDAWPAGTDAAWTAGAASAAGSGSSRT